MIKVNNSYLDNARKHVKWFLEDGVSEHILRRSLTEIDDIMTFLGFNVKCGAHAPNMFYHPETGCWVPYLVIQSYTNIIIINKINDDECKIEVYSSEDMRDLSIRDLNEIIEYKKRFVGINTRNALDDLTDAAACLLW